MQNVLPSVALSPEEETEEEVTVQEKEKMINISYELAAEASKRSKLVAGTSLERRGRRWRGFDQKNACDKTKGSVNLFLKITTFFFFYIVVYQTAAASTAYLFMFIIIVSVPFSFISLTLVIIFRLVISYWCNYFLSFCVCVCVFNMLLCFIAVKSLSSSSPPLPQSPNTPPQLTDGSHFMCV